ncbi:MAG: family 16 glycosylhydrolase [Saprospiraceae bacterium]
MMHFTFTLAHRRFINVALISLLTIQLSAQCPTLVWSDEFDGTTLNTAKWTPQIGDGCDINLCGWGNNELEYYRAENAVVSDGTLKIIAKRENFGNRSYTSARIRSINKGDWTYGRFEARIKLPTAQGMWPAFWMLPTDEAYGSWPRSGEMDIMELVGKEPDRVHGTIHYGNPWPNNSSQGKSFALNSGTFDNAFHTFAMEWEAGVIRWYVDDFLYSTKTIADVAPLTWPFDKRFHFLLNVAVGGNWPGNPNGSTTFPQTMEVDYVRVYNGKFPHVIGNRKVANQASNQVYTLNNVPNGSTINWTVPAGATIASGQGTNSISVNWGNSGGTIVATINNGCYNRQIELDVLV